MRHLIPLLILLTAFATLSAGVREHRKTTVRFTKFGTINNDTESVLSGLVKHDEVDGDAKGTGFMGKLIASMYPKGKNGTITDVELKKITTINHGEKEYSVQAIEPLTSDDKEKAGAAAEEEEQGPDRYRIIRNELKAVDTGQTSTINGYDTHRYNIIYLLEEEEIQTGVITTDSLFVTLDLTKQGDFRAAEAEQLAFTEALMKAMGLESTFDDFKDIMGLQWITMLSSMSPQPGKPEAKIDYSSLKKLEGDPVVIEGTYFTKKFDPNAPKQEESSPGLSGGLGGMLGAAARKAVTKPKKVAYEEQLYYRTELVSLKAGVTVSSDEFKVPAGYKEVKAKKK